jgi:hypothetical protein
MILSALRILVHVTTVVLVLNFSHSLALANPLTVAVFGSADHGDGLQSSSALCWLRFLHDDEKLEASQEILEASYPGNLKLWNNEKYFQTSQPICTTASAPTLVLDLRRGYMWSVTFSGTGTNPAVNFTRLAVDDWVRRLRFRGDRIDYFVARMLSAPKSSLVPACSAEGCAHYHELIIDEYPQLLANMALLVGSKTTELMPALIVARRGTAAPITPAANGALANWCRSLSLEFATSSTPATSDWILKCAVASAVQPITLGPARFLRFFQLPRICKNVVFDPASEQADLTANRDVAGAVITYFSSPAEAVVAGVPNFTATGCEPETTAYTTTIAWNASSMPLRTAPDAPPAEEGLCFTTDQIDRLVKPIQTTTFDAGGRMKQTRIGLRLTSAGGGLFSIVQSSIPDYDCTFGHAWSYSGGVDNLQKSGFHSIMCKPPGTGSSSNADTVRSKVALLSPLFLCK